MNMTIILSLRIFGNIREEQKRVDARCGRPPTFLRFVTVSGTT
jgi:hypothetical protein